MKSRLAKKVIAFLAILVFTCVFSVSYAQEKKKGQALLELEAAAGKKIEDVKVPAVPEPKPVKGHEVNKSTTTSFDVNKSTSTQKKE